MEPAGDQLWPLGSQLAMPVTDRHSCSRSVSVSSVLLAIGKSQQVDKIDKKSVKCWYLDSIKPWTETEFFTIEQNHHNIPKYLKKEPARHPLQQFCWPTDMPIQVGIHYSRIYNISSYMAPFHCQEMMQPIAEQYKGKFALRIGSVW